MKKLFFAVFVLLFGVIGEVEAQTYKFYSTDFAYKAKSDYGYWSDWSDWEPSHCLVTISLDRDVINIYSPSPQEFDVYDYRGESEDRSGGSTLELACVDQDGLRCTIRLRVQEDSTPQLYVDYNNVMYVYCLEYRN